MRYDQAEAETATSGAHRPAVAIYSVKRGCWCVKTAGHLCDSFEKQSARAWRDILNSIIPE